MGSVRLGVISALAASSVTASMLAGAPVMATAAASPAPQPSDGVSTEAPAGNPVSSASRGGPGPRLPDDLFSANDVVVPPSVIAPSEMSAKQRAMRRNVWLSQGAAFSVGVEQSLPGRVGGKGLATVTFARVALPGVAARDLSVRLAVGKGSVVRGAQGNGWRCRVTGGEGICRSSSLWRAQAVPEPIRVQVGMVRRTGHQTQVKAAADWREQQVVAGIGGGYGAMGTFRSAGWVARSASSSAGLDSDRRLRISASAVTGSPFTVKPGSPAGERTMQLQGRLYRTAGRKVSTRWSQLCTTPSSARRVKQCRGVTPEVEFVDSVTEAASARLAPQNVVVPPIKRGKRFVFQFEATGAGDTERRRVVVDAVTGKSGALDPRLDRVPDIAQALADSSGTSRVGAPVRVPKVHIAPQQGSRGGSGLQVIPGSRVRLEVRSDEQFRSVRWSVARGPLVRLSQRSGRAVSFTAPRQSRSFLIGARVTLRGGQKVSAAELVVVRAQHRERCRLGRPSPETPCKGVRSDGPQGIVCKVADRLRDPDRTGPDVVMAGDSRLYVGQDAELSGDCRSPSSRITFRRATLEKDGYKLTAVAGYIDASGVHVTRAALDLPEAWRAVLGTSASSVPLAAPEGFALVAEADSDGNVGPLVGNLVLPDGALGLIPLPEGWDMRDDGAGAPALQFSPGKAAMLVEIAVQLPAFGGGEVAFQVTRETDGRTRVAVLASGFAAMTDKKGHVLNVSGEGAVYFDQQGRFASTKLELSTTCLSPGDGGKAPGPCSFELMDGLALSNLRFTWTWDEAKKSLLTLSADGVIGVSQATVRASLTGTYRTATDWSVTVNFLEKWVFAEGFSADSGSGTISMKKVNDKPRLTVDVKLSGLDASGVRIEQPTATITNDCFEGSSCSALDIRVKIQGKVRIVIGDPVPDLVLDVTMWADLAARTVKVQVGGFPKFGPEGYVIQVDSVTLVQNAASRTCVPSDSPSPGAAIGFTGMMRTTGSKEVKIPVRGEFDLTTEGYCFVGDLSLRDTVVAYSTYRAVVSNGGAGNITITKPGTLMLGGSMLIPGTVACPLANTFDAIGIDGGVGSFNTRTCEQGVPIQWAGEVLFADKQRQENFRVDARMTLASGSWKPASQIEFNRLGLRLQLKGATLGGQELEGLTYGFEIGAKWSDTIPLAGSVMLSEDRYTLALRVDTDAKVWSNAFGVEGLTVNELGIGITGKFKPKPPDPGPDPGPDPVPPPEGTEPAAVQAAQADMKAPKPTAQDARQGSFMVTGAVTLPTRWQEKTGLVNSPQVRLAFSIGVGAVKSCAIFEVARYSGSDRLSDKNVIEIGAVSAKYLRIVYAPMGCTVLDGSGGTLNIDKGWSFAFDGAIAGTAVDAALTVRMPAPVGDDLETSFAMRGYLNIPKPLRWKGLEVAGCDRTAGPGCVPAPDRGPRFDVDIDTRNNAAYGTPRYIVKVDASIRIGTEDNGARVGLTGSMVSRKLGAKDGSAPWVTRVDLAGTGTIRMFGTDLANAKVNLAFNPVPYFDPGGQGYVPPFLKVDLAADLKVLGQGIAINAGLDYSDGDLQSFYAGAGVTLDLPGFKFSPDIFLEYCRGTLNAKRKNRDDAWKGCTTDKNKRHFRVYVAGKYKILWIERDIDMTLVDNRVEGASDMKQKEIPAAAPNPDDPDGKDIASNPDWQGYVYLEQPFDKRQPFQSKARAAVQLVGAKAGTGPNKGLPACNVQKHGVEWQPTAGDPNPPAGGGIAVSPSPCALEADLILGPYSGTSYDVSKASRVTMSCTRQMCWGYNLNARFSNYAKITLEQWDKGMQSARAAGEMILTFIKKQEQHEKDLDCRRELLSALGQGQVLRCDGAIGMEYPTRPAFAKDAADPFGMKLPVGTDNRRKTVVSRLELDRKGELTLTATSFYSQGSSEWDRYGRGEDRVVFRWKPQPDYSDEKRRGSYIQLVRRQDRCYLKMIAPDRTTLGYLPDKGRWADSRFTDDDVRCQLTPLAQGNAFALGGPTADQTLWLSDPDIRILRVANPTQDPLYLGEVAIDGRRQCVLAPGEEAAGVDPDMLRGWVPKGGGSRTVVVKKKTEGGCRDQEGYFGITLAADTPAKEQWGYQDFTRWYGFQYLDFKDGDGRSQRMLPGGWYPENGLPAGVLRQRSDEKSAFQLFEFGRR